MWYYHPVTNELIEGEEIIIRLGLEILLTSRFEVDVEPPPDNPGFSRIWNIENHIWEYKVIDNPIFPVTVPMDIQISTAKAAKISEINTACETALVSGVLSSATGVPRRYDSELTDQVNFTQARDMAILINTAIPYRCSSPDFLVKEWIPHSVAQFNQVMIDGAAIKAQLLGKASLLKGQAEAAQTLGTIINIHWDN